MTPAANNIERHATRDLGKFLLLSVQLAAILFVIWVFKIEGRMFGALSALMFTGFAFHYWLPNLWKRPFYILLSLAGAYLLLKPWVATLVIGSGLVFYTILNAPIGYSIRVSIVVLIGVACLAFRNYSASSVYVAEILSGFWPVLGGLFMFRLIVYIYDMRKEQTRGTFVDYLTYFFIPPNYYFLLFPVVDYQTLRSTYYNTEFHTQAQQGVRWIVRGVMQLLLYRLIYYLRPNPAPDDVKSFGGLVLAMVLTYLLYLRLSGQYHIIIGMMHLFGFNLPETHRRFLLASSFTDFWRRINIYWKDFMVKMIYYPAFFRLRRLGEVKATAIATLIVFGMTWLFHAYQFYWLSGRVLLAWNDALFWSVLGVLVLINVLLETRKQKAARLARAAAEPPRPKDWRDPAAYVVKVAATFSVITILWSMWDAKSLHDWIDLLTYWTPSS